MAKPIMTLLAAALALSPISAGAQGDDLRPISEYLTLPEDRKDAAYPILRCVGLFVGVYRYGGSKFSDEENQRSKEASVAMSYVALLIRQRKHPETPVDALASQIGVETEALSTMYKERFEKNYSMTGEAWGSDAIINDDFGTCGPIAQEAVDITSGLREQ